MGYKTYKVSGVSDIYIPDPPSGGGGGVSLYVQLAADYSNGTINPSDIVSGVITSTGADLLIQAIGLLVVGGNESSATVQGLTEDFPVGFARLYIDGVAQDHANIDVSTAAQLGFSTWFSTGDSPGSILVKISGLAPGAHTIAIKGALYAVPFSGAAISCFAASGPAIYGYNLYAVEV